MNITVNGTEFNVPDAWQSASLLTVLRDYLGLTGSKFGCGQGHCGACTVHIDGSAVRSCLTALTSIGDSQVTTIEGLAADDALHPMQQAWIDLSVPQCGYCQAGQIMTAAAFIAENPDPGEEEITDAMNGNLCRCGTYSRIRLAVAAAAEKMRDTDES